MPEPGMGNKSEEDGYGGRSSYDGGKDPYGSGRNTPWGPQSFRSGIMSGGLLGGLLGAINNPSTAKSLSSPGVGGYDTRDGSDRMRGIGGGMDLAGLLRQLTGNTQQPFPMYQMPQNYMPQITPMNPGTPGNVNELYAMYGATPGTSMPGGPAVPPPPAPSAPPPQITDDRMAFSMFPEIFQSVSRRTGG